MKTGAGISGGAHLALLAAAIFAGDFFGETQATPVAIAEVTMMTGTEFEAALSAAPEFNPDLPAAPEAPEPGEERADVALAETDAAPTLPQDNARDPDLPDQGETVVKPAEAQPSASIAEVADLEAAPPAPDGDTLVAETTISEEIAPAAQAEIAPAAPAPRPSSLQLDTSSPAPPPEPVEVAEPEEAPEPPTPDKPVEIAEAPEPPVRDAPAPEEPAAPEPPEPQDAAEVEPEKLNDPDIPAPKLAPPPPRKPKALAEAAKATRLAREQKEAEEQGATRQAEAPSGGGTTQTVGKLSFRDRDALRVGIRGFFSPPRGLPNEDQLAVKLQIQLSPAGKITAGPKTLEPKGRLDAAHGALMRAGVRALKKSEAAGVFSRLPKDKHARWRVMNVIFTPREIRFL